MLVIAKVYLNLTWWVRSLPFADLVRLWYIFRRWGLSPLSIMVVKLCEMVWKKMSAINIIIKTDRRKTVLRKIVIDHYFASYYQVILHHLPLFTGCAYIVSFWISKKIHKIKCFHSYRSICIHTHICIAIHAVFLKSPDARKVKM